MTDCQELCRVADIRSNGGCLSDVGGHERLRSQNICLWASEPYSLLCHNIKYLAGKIRKGNWATPWNARWPLPLFAFDEDAAGKVGVELIRAKRGELAAARLESVLTSCRQVVGYVAHPTSHNRTSDPRRRALPGRTRHNYARSREGDFSSADANVDNE